MNKNKPENLERQDISSWQIFTDLASLLSLFGGILYIGGYVYIQSYYNNFFMNTRAMSSNILFYVTTFANKVIMDNIFSILMSLILALIFVIFFYIARNILKPRWGYLSLCMVFIIVFLISTGVAGRIGNQHALRDWNAEQSHLPKVKIILDKVDFDPPFLELAGQSSLRIAYEGDDYVYLFKPRKPKDQSDLPVYVIPKKYIIQLDIFNIIHK